MPPDGKAASNGLPPLVSLEEFLATPDEELTYRVDQLWPTGGRVILAAAWKAGKTTLLGNLIRALVDGLAFLGLYAVQPAQRVVLIDDELDARTLRRWLRDQGIVNTQRVELVALRGKVSTFNILDRAICAQWAKHIGPADVLLFDCLRPVLDALNLKEATEAGRFLVAFDELLDEPCIPEAGIAHHMGHVGERSRGDSRLRDWPDAEWNSSAARQGRRRDRPRGAALLLGIWPGRRSARATTRLRPDNPQAHRYRRQPQTAGRTKPHSLTSYR